LVTATKQQRLRDAYRSAGFRPIEQVRGVFGDPHARIVTLVRRSKKPAAAGVGESIPDGTIASFAAFGIFRPAACAYFWSSRCGASGAGIAARRSASDWNSWRTIRSTPSALRYVGRRCRSSPIQDVATELKLDWHKVKELDKQYMRAQLAKAGTPAPMVIGIDEISVRKGHTYRIVVSDLIRERPIWFGGNDRSEASMTQFYRWLGPNKSRRIRLAVMDMWKRFRNAANAHAPQAAILFDKSISFATSAKPSIRFARASMHGCRERTVASSRSRNTRC
jgi:hypothetical protein